MSSLNTLVSETHEYGPQARLLGLPQAEASGLAQMGLAKAGLAQAGLAQAGQVSPRAVVCQDFGLATVGAVARRRLWPGAPLVLRVTRMPEKPGRSHRAILAAADVVLAASPVIAEALRSAGVSMARIVMLSRSDNDCEADGDLGMFAAALRPPIERPIRRLVHVGDLEPEAGVADFLACAQGWAARHPDRPLELRWAGHGCLRGVLQAQPLPPNLTQHFMGDLAREPLAALLLESDMLVAPAVSDPSGHAILEALTAGLPVLGSLRLSAVRELVTPGDTGWIFDPLQPRAMARALELALETTPEVLEETRARAVARFNSAPGSGLEERIQKALRLAPRRAGGRPVADAFAP